MSTLDQAFIRAFDRQAALPPLSAGRAAATAVVAERPRKTVEMPVAALRAAPELLPVQDAPLIARSSPVSSSSTIVATAEILAALEHPPTPMGEGCGDWKNESEKVAANDATDGPAESANQTPPKQTAADSASASRLEFRPAWQVDHFTWPSVCRRLIARAADELDRLSDALLSGCNSGKTVVAIAGCQRGEGATSILLCAARRLAERGLKPLLVDADLGRPRLAKRLGLHVQSAWTDVLAEGVGLDRAIVEAVANNLALLPARRPDAGEIPAMADLSLLAAALPEMRNHFDIILVDLGPLEDDLATDMPRLRSLAGTLDTVVMVHNKSITSAERLRDCTDRLMAAGLPVSGIVENFAAE